MNKIKIITITILTTVSAWLGILAVPIAVLVIFNLVDYCTGIIASRHRGQKIDSYKGVRGIFKKVLMWLLILVGAMLDWLVVSTGEYLGIKLPFAFVIAILVAVWLVFNETISILENIKDTGVELPPFLLPLVKNLKSQIEDKSNEN